MYYAVVIVFCRSVSLVECISYSETACRRSGHGIIFCHVGSNEVVCLPIVIYRRIAIGKGTARLEACQMRGDARACRRYCQFYDVKA